MLTVDSVNIYLLN